MNCHISKLELEPIFVRWFFIFRKLMSNIEKIHYTPEFLKANFGLRLGLKYSSSRSLTSEKWEMRTWTLGQIFKTQWNHFTIIFCSTGLHNIIFSLHTVFTQYSLCRSSFSETLNLRNLELRFWKLGHTSRPSYALLIINTVNYRQYQIAKKIFVLKIEFIIEAWFFNAGLSVSM